MKKAYLYSRMRKNGLRMRKNRVKKIGHHGLAMLDLKILNFQLLIHNRKLQKPPGNNFNQKIMQKEFF